MTLEIARSRWTPSLAAALLILPSVVYVALDQSVWPWDPASYGEHALSLYLKLLHGHWLYAMFHISGPHAPGIEWLGQWLIPLERWTGSTERALLLLTLFCQAATIALLWATLRELTGGALLPTIAGCLFVAAAPIYVGLSTKFFVEPMQLAAVTGLLWTAAGSTRLPRTTTLLALLLWGSAAMLAKITTPLYCFVPAAAAIWNLRRPPTQPDLARGSTMPSLLLGSVGLALAAMVAAWYQVNFRALLDFAAMASSSSTAELYGHRASFLVKVAGWFQDAGPCFTRWDLGIAFTIIAAASAALTRFHPAPRATAGPLLSAAALLAGIQIAAIVGVISLNVNEDARFSYAVLPYAGVVIAWLISRISPPAFGVACVGLLAFQYANVHALALGLLDDPSLCQVNPVERNPRKREALASLVATIADSRSDGRKVFVDVELPWLNQNACRFEARKQSRSTGAMPVFAGFGFDLLDADEAWKAILVSHPVLVIAWAGPAESGERTDLVALNRNSEAVLEKLRASASFVETGLAADSRVRVFRSQPVANVPVLPDGTFVKGTAAGIWVVLRGRRRVFSSMTKFREAGGREDLADVRMLPDEVLESIPEDSEPVELDASAIRRLRAGQSGR